MRRNFTHLLAVAFLSFAVILFFLPLFYPHIQLFVTPDNQLSDILHFNYPFKNFLSQSLKANGLPLWTNELGAGFPILAWGQIGTFHLANIILFFFFPTPIAFNLGYIVTFLLFAIGFYFVSLELGVLPIIAFIGAFVFTFSGFNIVRIPHYNTLQAFSYFPFLFLCVLRFIKKPASPSWLWIPFLLSQMIFAGHYQFVFMPVVYLVLYICIEWKFSPGKLTNTILLKLLIAGILGVSLAAIQLLPSYEFFLQSDRNTLIRSDFNLTGGFQASNVLQFISPYILGDIRHGTYPTAIMQSNFWETLGYIGIVPFFFALASLMYIRKSARIVKFWIIVGILFLFASEDHSPLYFLLSIAPFSMFQAHSRFIILIGFTLILLSSLVASRLIISHKKQRILVFLSIIVLSSWSMYELWNFGKNYNPIQPISYLLDTPQTAKWLQTQGKPRILSIGTDRKWFNEFTHNGWKNTHVFYELRNGLTPNISLIYGVENAGIYGGFRLRKHTLIENIVQRNLQFDDEQKTASFSATGLATIRMLSIEYVVSPYKITNGAFTLAHSVTDTIKQPYYIYRTDRPFPKYALVAAPKTARTIEELTKLLDSGFPEDGTISLDSTASSIPISSKIKSIKEENTSYAFETQSTAPGFFMLSLLNYPGWKATVDGTLTPIISANLYAMAIRVPTGTHTVTFFYDPLSLKIGAGVSVAAGGFYFILIAHALRRKRMNVT